MPSIWGSREESRGSRMQKQTRIQSLLAGYVLIRLVAEKALVTEETLRACEGFN